LRKLTEEVVPVMRRVRSSLYGGYVKIFGGEWLVIAWETKVPVTQSSFSVLLFTGYNIFLPHLILQLLGTFLRLEK